MKKLILMLAITSFLRVQAQDLVIRYDYIKDKYTYFQNDKQVSQPTIKRNYEVKVAVDNLNPFVFIARCSWTQKVTEDNSSTSAIAGMFTGLGGGAASISSLLSNLNMKQFEEAGTRGSNSLLSSNLNAKMALENYVSSFNNLVEVEQTLNRVDYSTSKLQKLKFNPYLPSDTLKKIAFELTANSLATKKTGNLKTFSASNFIQWSADLTNTLNEEFESMNNYAKAFLVEYKNFASSNGNNFSEAGMDEEVNKYVAAAKVVKAKFNSDIINTKIEALEQEYESIYYTPFTYNCNYMATGDLLSLTLDFFETSASSRKTSTTLFPSGDAVDTLRKIRTKSMNILIHGDMKIITSVGLGFPTYFDKNQTFSNRDSFISGIAGNNYAPCISTYISFYPYSGRNIHWGGTFGVGIPVQNEGTSALNFLLGGSAVLGSSSKVVIHGGLAIGQLAILSGGQKVGDNLGDKSALPTTKKSFQPGAFFGISFALTK